MPKNSRGGKAGSSVTQSQAQQSVILTQRRQQRQAQAQQRAAQTIQQAQQQAQQQGFNPLTQTQIQQNIQSQDDYLATKDIMTRYVLKQYGRGDQQAGGFSRSQNLNNKLQTSGGDLSKAGLDQTEKKMVKYMDTAMHPLKQDTLLVRGDHAIHPSGSGLMQRLGVANYQNMSQAQLSAALVGKTWTEHKYLSTSYDVNKNVFLNGNQSGGRSLVWNIKAKSGTNYVQARADQAEYVLARGGRYKITGARFTGATVMPRAGGSLKQIVIDVEVE